MYKKFKCDFTKNIWPPCGELCSVCRNILVFSLPTLKLQRLHCVNFHRKYAVIQVFSTFHIMSIKFIANFSSFLPLHFYHYVCLFDVCCSWGSGAQNNGSTSFYHCSLVDQNYGGDRDQNPQLLLLQVPRYQVPLWIAGD